MSGEHTEDDREEAQPSEGSPPLAEQAHTVAAQLEQADHEDLSRLADLHTLVEQLADTLRCDAHGEAAQHIDEAIDHLNDIIFGEADHPVELLQAMSRWMVEYATALESGEPPESLNAFSMDTVDSEEDPSPSESEDSETASDAFFDETPSAESAVPAIDDSAFLHQTISEGMEELVVDFVAEANDHLETCDVSLLTLETTPTDSEALDSVFRGFHTIKGVAGFLHLEHILNMAHEAENLLVKARDNELTLEGPAIDVIFESADLLKRLIGGLDVTDGGAESDVTGTELHALIESVKAVAEGRVPQPTKDVDAP